MACLWDTGLYKEDRFLAAILGKILKLRRSHPPHPAHFLIGEDSRNLMLIISCQKSPQQRQSSIRLEHLMWKEQKNTTRAFTAKHKSPETYPRSWQGEHSSSSLVGARRTSHDFTRERVSDLVFSCLVRIHRKGKEPSRARPSQDSKGS
jgi:hypothetical protein